MSGGVSKDENSAIFAWENASNSFLDNHPVTGSSTSKEKVHVRLKAWETSPSNTEDEKCRGVHGAACKDDQSGETPYPNFSESETSHLQHTCKCTATEASVVSPDENTTTDNSHQDLTVHSEILHSCRPCDECTVTKPYETLESASFKLFDELPHELFFKVLSYFSVHELCVIIAPVCRAWYEYSRSPVLWQYLDLSANPDIGSNQLCTLLERATLLKSLKLRGREQLSTCEIRMLKTCPFLNKIDLGFCDNVNCTILAEIVRCCEYLQVVNMEGCDLIDDRVAAQFPLLPCLKVLNLSHCTKMTDEAVVLIGQGCLLLEELNVDGIPWITDRAIKLLAAERSETMRAVYLDGAELTDESVMHLMRCPLLHTLSLSFCEQLTDRSLSMLQIANPLRHLRLRRGVEFSEDALCHFFACGTVQDLSFLDLSECSELVDEGVTNIAHRCHQLKQLALCWCWNVSDVGIEEIVEHCGQLKYLDIIGLDKVKGHCFSRIPEALPRLTFLDLRQCNLINDMMLIDLVKAKPDLDIINYYGVEVTPNMLS